MTTQNTQQTQTNKVERTPIFIKSLQIKGVVLEEGTKENNREGQTKVTYFTYPKGKKTRKFEWMDNGNIEVFDVEKHVPILRAKSEKRKQKKQTKVKWSKKEAEIILVTPRSTLFENESLHFQGVETDKDKVKTIVRNFAKNVVMMRRIYAEKNSNFKQVIPYVVIMKGNMIYTYERLEGGGEQRLHNKLSIGFGGHANEVKGRNFFDTIKINTQRELKEELNIKSKSRRTNTIGLINDDLEEVGKVHLGLLNTLTLSEDAEVSVRETDAIKGEWMTLEQLLHPDTFKRLESWSQYAVTALSKIK